MNSYSICVWETAVVGSCFHHLHRHKHWLHLQQLKQNILKEIKHVKIKQNIEIHNNLDLSRKTSNLVNEKEKLCKESKIVQIKQNTVNTKLVMLFLQLKSNIEQCMKNQ